MVLRATRKLMLWYLEQLVNSCYRIQSNQEINAKCNQSDKDFHAPVSGTNIGDLSQISRPYLKNKRVTLINALIGSIFWNKNISCHGTFKGLERHRLIGSAVAGFNHARIITKASATGLDATQNDNTKGICSSGSLVNNPVRQDISVASFPLKGQSSLILEMLQSGKY